MLTDRFYSRVREFFTKEIWEVEHDNLSKAGAFVHTQLQIFFLVMRGFVKDKCFSRAASLSYSTMLTIIPFFVLFFPILKVFKLEEQIKHFVATYLAAGNPGFAQEVFAITDNLSFENLGFKGLLFLLFVIIMIISNVEGDINDVWGIKKRRSVVRKFTDFFSILMIVPIFIFISSGLTAFIQNHEYFKELMSWSYVSPLYNILLKFLPFIFAWAAFTFFYLFIPNTKVRVRPAAIAGAIAGLMWQMAHWSFINFKSLTANYNLIYGTVAKLPIFMLWIFYSWVIVLLGSEVAFAYQNLKTYRLENQEKNYSFGYMQQLGLNIIISIADSFHYKKEPWSAEKLSEEFSASLRLVNEMLFMLQDEGFIAEISKPFRAYVPAFDIENMLVYDIIYKLKYPDSEDTSRMERLLLNDKIKKLVNSTDSALQGALKEVTVKTLIT